MRHGLCVDKEVRQKIKRVKNRRSSVTDKKRCVNFEYATRVSLLAISLTFKRKHKRRFIHNHFTIYHNESSKQRVKVDSNTMKQMFFLTKKKQYRKNFTIIN